MTDRHFGPFEQTLLYAVRHLQSDDDGASGPSIRRLIEAETGRAVSPGAIYTAMDRLEQRGFVRSAFGDPTPERGGKRKRLYQMRAAGQAALRSAESHLKAMAKLSRKKA